jgi:hypothetical protein
MADPEKRRSWFHIEKVGNLSVKKTLLKFAPTLRLGSIFGGPVMRTVLAAAALAAPAAIVAESAGAIDVIDSDPQVVELTIISANDELELIIRPPSVAGGTVFDQILDAIAGIETDVTVTVAPIDAQTRQTLIQIGSLLEILQAQGREHAAQHLDLMMNLGILLDRQFPPGPPSGLTQAQADAILDQLDAIEAGQDVIEDAIFPGRGVCPECPDSVTE